MSYNLPDDFTDKMVDEEYGKDVKEKPEPIKRCPKCKLDMEWDCECYNDLTDAEYLSLLKNTKRT
ncbi:hypothetical protein OAG36_00775 [bacterium]|nr:hypothetical protein [bacterium]